MKTTKKNALAELAEQLASIGVLHYSGGTIQTDNLHPLDLQAISKAQRIVAELAKVSDGHWEVICDGPPAYLCDAGDLRVQCCIGHCVDIAAGKEAK